jgi:WD40 repeat protein
LGQEAPACRALPLLRRLAEAGWRPDDPAERAGFEELARLARAWPGRDDELRTLVPCRAVLEPHDGAVYAVALSPDGGLFASGGGGDNAVRLARFPAGEPLQTLQGHSAPVTELVFSPDGRHLASVAARSLRLWAVPEARLVYRFKREIGERTLRVAFSPDGRLLAFLAGTARVEVFDIAKSAPANSLSLANPGPGVTATPFALTPDGKTLITHGSSSRTVELWSFLDGLPLRTLEVPGNERMVSAAVSADSKTLVTGGTSLAYVWALPKGELRETLTEQPGTNLRLGCGAGGHTVVVSWGGGPELEDDTPTMRCLPGGAPRTLVGHGRGVNDLAFSPDGGFVASGSKDGTVRLWDVPVGRPLAALEHDREVECVAFSPDGRLLVSGGRDRTVRLWGLDLLRSASVPVGRTPPELLARVEEALRRQQLPPGERGALEFTAALMRWRRRFDITLDPGPRRIDAGEFDIVIEG